MWTKSPEEHRGTENEEEATSDIDGETSGNAKILNITTVVVVIWQQIVISHDFCNLQSFNCLMNQKIL